MTDVYSCKTRIHGIDKIKAKLLNKIKLYEDEQKRLKEIIIETMDVVAQYETLQLKTIKSKAKYGIHWKCDNSEVLARVEKLRAGRPIVEQFPMIHKEIFDKSP